MNAVTRPAFADREQTVAGLIEAARVAAEVFVDGCAAKLADAELSTREAAMWSAQAALEAAVKDRLGLDDAQLYQLKVTL